MSERRTRRRESRWSRSRSRSPPPRGGSKWDQPGDGGIDDAAARMAALQVCVWDVPDACKWWVCVCMMCTLTLCEELMVYSVIKTKFSSTLAACCAERGKSLLLMPVLSAHAHPQPQQQQLLMQQQHQALMMQQQQAAAAAQAAAIAATTAQQPAANEMALDAPPTAGNKKQRELYIGAYIHGCASSCSSKIQDLCVSRVS